MTDIDPDHPLMLQGRRHSRDVMESAARLVRLATDSKTADAAATLSTALQLMTTCALVDGFETHTVYDAVAGLLSWSVRRLPPEQRKEVLAAMVKGAVDQIADWRSPISDVEKAALN